MFDISGQANVSLGAVQEVLDWICKPLTLLYIFIYIFFFFFF